MANLIGGNGQGFFQNLDETTKTWLHEAFENRPFIINFPGGAEANIATPAPLLKGWGLTEEIINQRFGAGQIDENGEGLEKWLGKLQQQNLETQSYIYDLQALKSEFPNMEIVWKSNIVSGSLEAAKVSFQSVYALCPFTRCVMGNEVYSKGNFNFNFSAFLENAEPLMDWIRANYPQVKIAVPFAPNLSRADHLKWDNDLIAFSKNSWKIDAVDVHIYLGADELVEAYASYPEEKYVFDKNKYYPLLEYSFNTFCEEYRYNEVWEDTISFIEQNLPFHEIWMTEFNTNPSGNFGNSMANAAFLFSRFMEFNHRVHVMCVHNLVAPDIYGCISRTDNFDLNKSNYNTRRTGYYALRLASEALQYNVRQSLGVYQEADVNTCYYYDNTLGYQSFYEINPFTQTSGGGGKVLDYIDYGQCFSMYTYDSLGKIGYLDKKTPAFNGDFFFEGEYASQDNRMSNPNPSFGYIYFAVKDAPPPPPTPCNRKWWQLWKKPCGQKAVPAVNTVNLKTK